MPDEGRGLTPEESRFVVLDSPKRPLPERVTKAVSRGIKRNDALRDALSAPARMTEGRVLSAECCEAGCTCTPSADCTCNGCTGNYEDTPGGY